MCFKANYTWYDNTWLQGKQKEKVFSLNKHPSITGSKMDGLLLLFFLYIPDKYIVRNISVWQLCVIHPSRPLPLEVLVNMPQCRFYRSGGRKSSGCS